MTASRQSGKQRVNKARDRKGWSVFLEVVQFKTQEPRMQAEI